MPRCAMSARLDPASPPRRGRGHRRATATGGSCSARPPELRPRRPVAAAGAAHERYRRILRPIDDVQAMSPGWRATRDSAGWSDTLGMVEGVMVVTNKRRSAGKRSGARALHVPTFVGRRRRAGTHQTSAQSAGLCAASDRRRADNRPGTDQKIGQRRASRARSSRAACSCRTHHRPAPRVAPPRLRRQRLARAAHA